MSNVRSCKMDLANPLILNPLTFALSTADSRGWLSGPLEDNLRRQAEQATFFKDWRTSLTSSLFENFSHLLSTIFDRLKESLFSWNRSLESTSCPKTCFTKSMGVLLLRRSRTQPANSIFGKRCRGSSGLLTLPGFHSLHDSMIYSFTVAPGVFGIRLGLATKPQYPAKKSFHTAMVTWVSPVRVEKFF